MGFRDKLEDKKAVKSEAQTQEQASLEQEEAAAQELSNANFKKTFQERASLSEALESFQASSGAVTRAKEARKRSATDVAGMITEAKEIDPTEEVTFKEVLKGANEEEKLGVGESEEARYHTASQEVKTARKQALFDAQGLRALGVDAEGKNEAELTQELTRVANEKQKELEVFVRANPNSELPESQEVKKQIIHKEIDSILDRSRGFNGVEKSFGRAAEDFQKSGWRDEYFEDPSRFAEAQHHITRDSLRSFTKAPGFQDFLASVAKLPEDNISQEAVSQLVKQILLNYKEKEDGSIEHINGIYSYDTIGYEAAPRLLARIYEMDGQKLPDEAYYQENGKKYSLKGEAAPLLATVFDAKQMHDFAEKALALAREEKKLMEWDKKEQAAKENERSTGEELEQARREESQKRERLERVRNQHTRTHELIEEQKQVLAKLGILRTEFDAGEPIEENRFGKITFVHDKEADTNLRQETDEKLKVAEDEARAKRTILSNARNAKKGLLDIGGKKKEEAIAAARKESDEAEAAIARVKTENQAAFRQLYENDYSTKVAARLPENVDTSGITTWGEYIARAKEALEKTSGQHEKDLENVATDITTKQEELTVLQEATRVREAEHQQARGALEDFSGSNRQGVTREVESLRSALEA